LATIEERSIRIDATFVDRTALDGFAFSGSTDETMPIRLADGIALSALFVSSHSSRAVGSTELLGFLVTVSSSVAAKALADIIYKWFKDAKATKLRIERTEITVAGDEGTVVRTIHEVITKQLR
jgi:hypothetical protein